MGQFFVIHPENPQSRLIKQAVKIILDGGIIIYPTDSAYAIGCQLENKHGLDRIRQLRHLEEGHHFSLICRDLSEIATYAIVDNPSFRLLKAHTPGPYTFILKATKEVPRRLLHPKRQTIGLRIPDNRIVQALLTELNGPLMSVTLAMPDQEVALIDARDINDMFANQVDLIIDGGSCGTEGTTVVDLVDGKSKVIREGKGDVKAFQNGN